MSRQSGRRLGREPDGAAPSTARSLANDPRHIALLRHAVDVSGEVVFITGIDGVFTCVNQQFAAVYGYGAQEVVGRPTPRILGLQFEFARAWMSRPRTAGPALDDIVMPTLGGPGLAQRPVEWRPSMRVLYVSGYTEALSLASGSERIKVVRKPITSAVLATAVRLALDGD